MSETLLKVEKRDDGLYIVEYGGRELGLLASPIQTHWNYELDSYDRCQISFYAVELPIQPLPAPKRTRARAYGLRTPK